LRVPADVDGEDMEAAGWGRRWVGASRMAVVVAVLGAVAGLGSAVALAAGQRKNADAQLERRAAAVADAVTSEAGRYGDTLRTAAAAVGAFEYLTADKFAQVVEPLSDMGLAGASSVVFLVPALDADVAATQALWRSRGVPDLVLQPAPFGREHVFTVFNVPLDGTSGAPPGIDAIQSPAAAQALGQARRTGRVAISAPYQLIIDRDVPAERRQLSFSLTAPVYAADGGFRGWVLMGLRGRDFITATLNRVGQDLIDVALVADDLAGRDATIATLRATVSGERDLHREVGVKVADRPWRLRVDAAGRQLPGGTTGLPTAVAGGSLILSLLLGGLVWTLATGRARARAQVVTATADLAATEAEARRQAGLLAAVLDSISDGVGVVDENGEFLLHNPAARAMLGLAEDTGGAENWQGHYGIYLTDATTPFPTEQLPLVRALAGEATEQVEMVIRNPANPDGITITVSGRPLAPTAGQTGAVAVFHDITDRKAAEAHLAATVAQLREREAELHAFAAVVAHDLKSPLQTIGGYAALLADSLTSDPDIAEMRSTLDPIRRGVERMRRLIDDLLTYATARDRTLTRTAVDLQAVVRDVVTERTSHLRTTGTDPATGQPVLFPDIYTGPLPVIDADPVLIRQLLDNLIGNALKYTLPAQPARIDIAAHPDRPGWTRIEIGDRGIGIPTTDQPHVFDTFHRSTAHRRYSGHGLGLAICKKIIDRHGGTIEAIDNPGGGTRIILTLPTGTATADLAADLATGGTHATAST
jgi:signal transduction histidine kinase